MLRKMTIELTGTRPLVMSNGQTADPLNTFAKAKAEISAKRKKSEEDHQELGRREFLGALYTNEAGAPIVPAQNLHAMLGDGAKQFRDGKLSKSSIQILEDAELIYSGPKDPDKLAADDRFIFRRVKKVQQARVVRTRPIFRNWSLQFDVLYDSEEINNPDTIRRWAEGAGKRSGLGDDRPFYGLFTAKVLGDNPVA